MSLQFSEVLFALRRRQKLLQKTVAHTAKIDQSYLAALERGRRDPPRKPVLTRLADCLCRNDAERRLLVQSASVARILRLMEPVGDEVDGLEVAQALLRALPRLSKPERDLIEDLVGLLSKKRASLEEVTI